MPVIPSIPTLASRLIINSSTQMHFGVLEKNAELAEFYRMKKPGVSNDNWVFNKISNNINSEIFYYHVNEVGYKRTKVKIKIRENELFEVDTNGKLKLDKKLLKKIREDIKWQ